MGMNKPADGSAIRRLDQKGKGPTSFRVFNQMPNSKSDGILPAGENKKSNYNGTEKLRRRGEGGKVLSPTTGLRDNRQRWEERVVWAQGGKIEPNPKWPRQGNRGEVLEKFEKKRL